MARVAREHPPWASWPWRLRPRRPGLRGRMALSYAVTTLVAVLVLELVVATAVWLVATRTGLADQQVLVPTRQTAKLYALAAAAQAGAAALDPRTTFAPGEPASIALPAGYFPSGTGQVPYVAGPAGRADAPFALLFAPDGRVLASSNLGRYPPGTSATVLLPGRAGLVAQALAGQAASAVNQTASGRVASAAEPVLDRTGHPIGAVYVAVTQASPTRILRGLTGFLPISAAFWSLLTLPVGALFGLLTTRGLVRRIDRLVATTERFASGDYGQRVPIAATDEVGQLEWHFNQMADQLVTSMAQRQRLVEQQARQEERARIDQELRTARQIQESLLPKAVPRLAGWRLTPYYRPATDVGGDFYDFVPLADGLLAIVIGDASGKGVPAALMMATARTMLRTAARATAAPGEVLARVNDLLAGDVVPGMFVTCFYALFEPAAGRLRFANAGHDLPYRRHGEDASELRATGMPLGLMPGMRYEEGEVTLAAGDTVLFYSDGLVEAHNGQGELFGFPRLRALLPALPHGTSPIDGVLQALAEFTGAGWEQEDDLTLLTLGSACTAADPVGAEPGLGAAARPLTAFRLPSAPGNERVAAARVADAVRGLGFPTSRLERLETAVAEATANAMEHGNGYRSDLPVYVQVLAAPDALTVRIDDAGTGPIAEPPEPDLAAKLAGQQAPRGWGLFLG